MTKKEDRLEIAMTRLQQRIEIEQSKLDPGSGILFLGILVLAAPGIAAADDLTDPVACLRDVRELVDALIVAGES